MTELENILEHELSSKFKFFNLPLPYVAILERSYDYQYTIRKEYNIYTINGSFIFTDNKIERNVHFEVKIMVNDDDKLDGEYLFNIYIPLVGTYKLKYNYINDQLSDDQIVVWNDNVILKTNTVNGRTRYILPTVQYFNKSNDFIRKYGDTLKLDKIHFLYKSILENANNFSVVEYNNYPGVLMLSGVFNKVISSENREFIFYIYVNIVNGILDGVYFFEIDYSDQSRSNTLRYQYKNGELDGGQKLYINGKLEYEAVYEDGEQIDIILPRPKYILKEKHNEKGVILSRSAKHNIMRDVDVEAIYHRDKFNKIYSIDLRLTEPDQEVTVANYNQARKITKAESRYSSGAVKMTAKMNDQNQRWYDFTTYNDDFPQTINIETKLYNGFLYGWVIEYDRIRTSLL